MRIDALWYLSSQLNNLRLQHFPAIHPVRNQTDKASCCWVGLRLCDAGLSLPRLTMRLGQRSLSKRTAASRSGT